MEHHRVDHRQVLRSVGAALSGPAALAVLSEVFPEGAACNRAFGVYAAVGAGGFSGGMVLGDATVRLAIRIGVLRKIVGVVVLAGIKKGLPSAIRIRLTCRVRYW